MANERLRALLLERGQTPGKLADAVHVDPKTVERWVTKGRIPYRAHRYAVAAFFGVDEAYIWPDALSRDQVAAVSESEILAVYPHRSEVPRDVWEHLFSSAEREIGVLVYAGLFLSEDARVQRIIKSKAGSGCGCCSGIPTAAWWPSAGKMKVPGTLLPPRSAMRSRCTGRCAVCRAWSSGFTGRCCTTRSTSLTTSCWSTRTSTGRQQRRRPSGTCTNWPEASWPACTSTASSGSGNRRRRPREVRARGSSHRLL